MLIRTRVAMAPPANLTGLGMRLSGGSSLTQQSQCQISSLFEIGCPEKRGVAPYLTPLFSGQPFGFSPRRCQDTIASRTDDGGRPRRFGGETMDGPDRLVLACPHCRGRLALIHDPAEGVWSPSPSFGRIGVGGRSLDPGSTTSPPRPSLATGKEETQTASADLWTRRDSATCSGCGLSYRGLRGILDLRTADDVFLSNRDDWAFALRLDRGLRPARLPGPARPLFRPFAGDPRRPPPPPDRRTS